MRGEVEEAELDFEAARGYFRKTNDAESLTKALIGLGAMYTERQEEGKLSDALRVLKEVLSITRDPTLLAEAHLRRGICLRRLGLHFQALGELNKNISSWKSLGNAVFLSEALVARGDVYRDLGPSHLDDAEKDCQDSLDVIQGVLTGSEAEHESEQKLYNLAQAQFALGRILIEKGNYRRAESLLKQAFGTLERISNFYGLEICAQLLGRLYMEIESWDDSRRWYNESYLATAITRNEPRRIETLYFLSELAYAASDSLRAKKLASVSASDAQSLNFLKQLARLLILLGHIAFDSKVPDESLDSYKKAIIVGVQSAPMATPEVFSRLQSRLVEVARQGDKLAAGSVIEKLLLWWPHATIDGKSATAVEMDNLHHVEAEPPPREVARYLRALQEAIAST